MVYLSFKLNDLSKFTPCRDGFDVGNDEGLDDFRAEFLKSGDGAVVRDERRPVVLEAFREHPRDSGLDVVSRRVEVLADVGHQAGGEVAESPVIVHLK